MAGRFCSPVFRKPERPPLLYGVNPVLGKDMSNVKALYEMPEPKSQ
jgi:hypothetical protein